MIDLIKKFFYKKKETKIFFILIIIIYIFYKIHMTTQYIEKNYSDVILKTYNNEYTTNMRIKGELNKEKVFSNAFLFEGTIEIDNKEAILESNFEKGKIYVFINEKLRNVSTGMMSSNPEKSKEDFYLANVICSNDFKKIYIDGKRDFGFEIFVSVNSKNEIKKYISPSN